MAEDGSGQDFDAEDLRLTRLDQGLRKARAREAARSGVKVDADRGYAQGNRVIAALIGSLVGSALIGWLIQRWFPVTSPWALIVMLFLGIAVAFRQIIRIGSERPE